MNKIKINRKIPFNPATFSDSGWSIESQDEEALKLKEIDFSKVSFENGLKEDETWITGKENLKRLQTEGILLDAAVAQALYEEKGQKTLRTLYNEKKVDWMEFSGTVLRDSGGNRCFF